MMLERSERRSKSRNVDRRAVQQQDQRPICAGLYTMPMRHPPNCGMTLQPSIAQFARCSGGHLASS
jgi:hypothetical protein